MLTFGIKNALDKQLFFRAPFTQRYTLTIRTDVMAGSLPIQTVTEIRWDLRVLRVEEEWTEIEVFTLDNELIETNNPYLRDLARMNQAFARMYSEIHVHIDRGGQVIEVLNEDVIRKKWAATKREMEAIDRQSDAIRGIVQMNDAIFTSPEKIVEAVKHNEFFDLYFNQVYGKRIPGETSPLVKWNQFQQVKVEWGYDLAADTPLPAAGNVHAVTVDLKGYPLTRLDKAWIKKAYGAFQNIDPERLQPRLSELGKYVIEPKTGRLKNAYLLKEEVADPQLVFSKMEYTLTSQT
jgi:hypothetical protein